MKTTFILLASFLIILFKTNVFAEPYSSYKHYHGSFVRSHLDWQSSKCEHELERLIERSERQGEFKKTHSYRKKVKAINRYFERLEKKFHGRVDSRYYYPSNLSKYKYSQRRIYLKKHPFHSNSLGIVILKPSLWFKGQLHH